MKPLIAPHLLKTYTIPSELPKTTIYTYRKYLLRTEKYIIDNRTFVLKLMGYTLNSVPDEPLPGDLNYSYMEVEIYTNSMAVGVHGKNLNGVYQPLLSLEGAKEWIKKWSKLVINQGCTDIYPARFIK